MNLNIARQPLVPAFLTLAALTVLAMWNAGALPETLPGAVPALRPEIPVISPAHLLVRFQTACPGWSRWIGAVLILFTAMCTGRLTVRYNLYSVGTCLAIPLYAAITGGLAVGGNYLPALTASALLALAAKNYCRSFCNGYGFDALFRASFYLGILPLVVPASLPLVAMLPLAILLFRRTLREVTVAIAGLLLPMLTCCYLNWALEGDFLEPLTFLWKTVTRGCASTLLLSMPFRDLTLLGGIILLDLFALLYFLSDSYALGTKSRSIFIFYACLLFLSVATLFNPAASTGSVALIAVPSAVLLPFLFVRIHRTVASALYLLLITAVLANLLLQ